MHRPLRLRCDPAALVRNYDVLRKTSGVEAGAAVKANGYGLGADEVVSLLLRAGCRDFFVSTWWEAAGIRGLADQGVAVLHGLGPDDQPLAGCRPVLNSVDQVARWKASPYVTEPCDIMVDTGINRLGLSLSQLDALDGLIIHTIHSHLACADQDHPLNDLQLQRFREVRTTISAQRFSLANSAGVFLGPEFAFDLVRPGLALYGGIPRPEARNHISPVAKLEAQVLQIRSVRVGESIGYNATFVADADLRVAILNIGYADGYWRSFSAIGAAWVDNVRCPVIGRVSMDLVAINVSDVASLAEGDWVELDFDLESAARQTRMSQYELLTGLGHRFERLWS